MDDCLRIDLDRLRDTARGLGALERELTGAGRLVEEASGDVGSQHVVAALEDAVDDWRLRRERLVAQLAAVKEMAQQSAETFEAVDRQLAAEADRGRGVAR